MTSSMLHILVAFSRSRQTQVEYQEFRDAEPAMQAYSDAEHRYRSYPDVEVVLLSTDSRETAEATHRRFFPDDGRGSAWTDLVDDSRASA